MQIPAMVQSLEKEFSKRYPYDVFIRKFQFLVQFEPLNFQSLSFLDYKNTKDFSLT